MIEQTLLGRVLHACFTLAGLVLVVAFPAALILALLAPNWSPGGVVALDLALGACRMALRLAVAATAGVLMILLVPRSILDRSPRE